MASKESQEVNGELYSKNSDTLNKDELISEDGKNMKWVVCQFCGSKVLRPNSGRYLEREFILPLISAKNQEPAEPEREKLMQFWLVGDMFTFENVGFSKTVNTTKYLVCADCEIGPIGFLDIQEKNKHYVALGRVKHQ